MKKIFLLFSLLFSIQTPTFSSFFSLRSIPIISSFYTQHYTEKLWKAIYQEDINLAETAIKNGADVNDLGNVGWLDRGRLTPLSRTVNMDNLDMALLLIKHGAYVNQKNEKFASPLMWAINRSTMFHAYNRGYNMRDQKEYKQSLKMIELLLDHGANLNQPITKTDSKGKQTKLLPLSWAINEDNLELTQLLLKKGDNNINTIDPPLQKAIRGRKSSAMVPLLLDYGADPNQLDECGRTPLIVAVQENKRDIVQMLIDAGADINKGQLGRDKLLYPPLWQAIRNDNSFERGGNLPMMKLLLSNGANVDQTDQWGHTPLWWRAYHGNPKEARMLLAYGANPNICLRVAAEMSQVRMVQILLENGADPRSLITERYELINDLLKAATGSIDSIIKAYLVHYPAILSSLFLYFPWPDFQTTLQNWKENLTGDDVAPKKKLIEEYEHFIAAYPSEKWTPPVSYDFLKWISSGTEPITSAGKELKILYSFLKNYPMNAVKNHMITKLHKTAALSGKFKQQPGGYWGKVSQVPHITNFLREKCDLPLPLENKVQEKFQQLPDDAKGVIASFIK